MRVRPETTGASLGGTLLAVAVLSLLAFTLANLSVTHLHLVNRQDRGLLAANAARSAVSTTISKILQQNEFGQLRQPSEMIKVQQPEAEGFLTFNIEQAHDLGVQPSTNNLGSSTDVAGSEGAKVPSGTVHLLAFGSSGDVRRRVDAVLRVPTFPWAIASTGRLDSMNGILVAALPQGVWPPPTDLKRLLPADIVSNQTGKRAIVLDSKSTVLGDVESAGEVELAGGKVYGEVRNNSRPVKLPALRLEDYADPRAKELEHFEVEDASTREIVGSARVDGAITFTNKLKLSNAYLFVDGALRLPQGVEGTGTLVATGDIEVGGTGMDLKGLTEVGVVSGGKVTLLGAEGRSFLRGFFYAQRGIVAKDLTLVGSLLSGLPPDTPQATSAQAISLDNVSVIYDDTVIPNLSFNDVDAGGVDIRGIENNRVDANGDIHGHVEGFEFKRLASRPDQDEVWIKDSDVPNLSRITFLQFTYHSGPSYPVTLKVYHGWLGIEPTEWVFHNEGDIEKFVAAVDAYYKSDYWVSAYDPGVFDPLVETIRRGVIEQIQEGPMVAVEPGPAARLFGDLSQFIPLEDRMRVVTWIER